jgi:outer membrane murein-binding lipoprotein Lpp
MMRAACLTVVALTLLLGCRGDASARPAKAEAAAEEDDFDAVVAAIEVERRRLAKRFAAAADDDARAAIRAEARGYLVDAIADELFPHWLGTPWGLGKNSTATRPHQEGMTVGCSYFVTSVLQNAGVVLDNRYRFAQAPALRIQGSLAPGSNSIHRFLSIAPAKLERGIRALGEGLYLIGLNNHVGFVLVRGGEVRFVHASYTGDQKVSDELLAGAEAIASSQKAGYFVSPVFAADEAGSEANAWLVDRWLAGAEVPFVAQ